MNRVQKLIFIVPLAILAMLVFVAVGGKIILDLWNWLLPPLFGWHEITFWQALGILVLCRILFGGRGWHGVGRSNFRRRMKERCGNMNPEDREKFRQRMSDRFGFGPSRAESKG
jgi:hypothetical protein